MHAEKPRPVSCMESKARLKPVGSKVQDVWTSPHVRVQQFSMRPVC